MWMINYIAFYTKLLLVINMEVTGNNYVHKERIIEMTYKQIQLSPYSLFLYTVLDVTNVS